MLNTYLSLQALQLQVYFRNKLNFLLSILVRKEEELEAASTTTSRHATVELNSLLVLRAELDKHVDTNA